LRQLPTFDEPPRLERPQGLLDEHRCRGFLDAMTIRARDVVAAVADSSIGGMLGGTVAQELGRVGRSLGHGLDEAVHGTGHVLPSERVLHRLGARPTQAPMLDRWWERARTLAREDRGRDRGAPAAGRFRS
jgi:hypothetical protein